MGGSRCLYKRPDGTGDQCCVKDRLSVPGDLSDKFSDSVCQDIDPPLTTVQQPVRRLFEAAKMLADDTWKRIRERHLVRTQLIVRKSY